MNPMPTLVVVGRVNEGKTSIVSTLVENDSAKVGPEPGTTLTAESYIVAPAGHPLFRVVDTPGFQEPERCLKWLMQRAQNSAQRAAAVRAFVDSFRGGKEFEDEWRLLEPVLQEGFVLYVVDASHPYRKSYESEMEILRWTGRPAIALLNSSPLAPYAAEWRLALQQHFTAVRDFNAHAAGFADRLSLLSLLSELDERLKAPLREAIIDLESDRDGRLRQVAETIASAVIEIVSLRLETAIAGETATPSERERQRVQYCETAAKRELDARRTVEKLLRHDHLVRREDSIDPALLGAGLFVGESWEFFGLNKSQLITVGTIAGALGGLGLDAATVGHSLGLGAAIGAGLGAAGTSILAFREPRSTIKLVVGEIAAGQHKLIVGPTEHPNFPWVVLGRAVNHARLVQARTHAQREPLTLMQDDHARPLASLSSDQRRQLTDIFRQAQRDRLTAEARESFCQIIRQLLDL